MIEETLLPADHSPIPGTHRVEVPEEDLPQPVYTGGDVNTPAAWDDGKHAGVTCWFIGDHRAHVTEWSHLDGERYVTYCVEADPKESIERACEAYCRREGYGSPVWDSGLTGGEEAAKQFLSEGRLR